MRIIEPTVSIITPRSHIDDYVRLLEEFGATAYKGMHQITGDSADDFVQRYIIERGHESILEHLVLSARFICDRSASHQLVRHRIAAYTQESQRVTSYTDGIEVVCPPDIRGNADAFEAWQKAMVTAEEQYRALINAGVKPEDARSVLPQCVKTEVVATFNLRTWRHVFLRRALNMRAQWQIRELMLKLLKDMHELLPVVFADLEPKLLYQMVFESGADHSTE